MTEKDSQSDSQDQQSERKFSQEQYEKLIRCSKKKDMTEWNQWCDYNQWFEEHPAEILLENADLRQAHLEHALLWGAHLKNADLRGANLENAALQGAHLENAILWGHLENAALQGAHLENADLQGAHLENANLCYAHLLNANLRGAHLENADLHRAHLENATLWGAHLENADLREAYLEHVILWDAHLENADLRGANLENAKLWGVHLENAILIAAGLQDAEFNKANLQDAKLIGSNLKNAYFDAVELQGADVSRAIVDGGTLIWRCQVDRNTKFEAVGLDNMRIYPRTKQLFEYNIRRMNWEEWYGKHPKLKWLVKPFWLMSDYGMSTKRIAFVFFGLALVFANVYYNWSLLAPPGIVENLFVDRNGVDVQWWLVPLRTLYFSFVTQTTLGFGDMYARAQSISGHILLSLQVILGYVLLGALVTRFAVLFTAGGPAGEFTEK